MAHDLCDLVQINEAGQPSILTSKPKDDKINIVIPDEDDIKVFRLDAATADNDTELVANIELDEDKSDNYLDFGKVEWHYKYGKPDEIPIVKGKHQDPKNI
jgi:hypothetical protein